MKSQIQNKSVFQQFEKRKKQIKEQESKKKDKNSNLKIEMQQYNKKIAKEGQKGLKDPWSYEQTGISLEKYGITDGVLGKIKIPKMQIELPLYSGASQEHMEKGAAVLGQTSMPLGGENTNCVIAGHRGYKGVLFFRNIEMLALGDRVIIQNFWEQLQYQVTDIEIISPEEVEKVFIQKKKDMITLITCHPYPTDQYRYVVFCERVSETEQKRKTEKQENTDTFNKKKEEAVKQDQKELEKEKYLTIIGYLLYLLIGIGILISFLRLKRSSKFMKDGKKSSIITGEHDESGNRTESINKREI